MRPVDPKLVSLTKRQFVARQRQYGLDGHVREAERIAEAEVTGTGAEQRDLVGIADVEQVDDLALGEVRTVAGDVDHERLLPGCRRTLAVVALGHDQLVAAVGDGVGDQRAGDRHPVRPGAAGVATLGDVELVDPAVERVIAGDRAFEDRVQGLAVARERHRLEAVGAAEVARAAEQVRVVGRAHGRVAADARDADRRLEDLAVGVGVDDERPELLAEPERPVRCLAHRLDVEVAAGQDALVGGLVDDRERELAVGIAERDRPADHDVAAPAPPRPPARAHLVQAQDERARVGLVAEAVVGHRVEVAVPGVEQRREAADGLGGVRRGRRIGVRDAGEGRGERRVRGQDRPRLEPRLGGVRRGRRAVRSRPRWPSGSLHARHPTTPARPSRSTPRENLKGQSL